MRIHSKCRVDLAHFFRLAQGCLPNRLSHESRVHSNGSSMMVVWRGNHLFVSIFYSSFLVLPPQSSTYPSSMFSFACSRQNPVLFDLPWLAGNHDEWFGRIDVLPLPEHIALVHSIEPFITEWITWLVKLLPSAMLVKHSTWIRQMATKIRPERVLSVFDKLCAQTKKHTRKLGKYSRWSSILINSPCISILIIIVVIAVHVHTNTILENQF